MKNILFTISFLLLLISAFSQADYQYLNVQRRFTLASRTVKGISNDTAWLVGSADSLVTQYAVQGYISNNFSRGGSFAYNFNPEQFIQNGQDISIRFPQDPGEPLFTGSPAFNFTQQHLDFLDSLMLAVGQDTYLDDRDFYYSPDTLNPIRWKAFTFSTTGTGAASWDSANRHLNIPVSSGGSGGTVVTAGPYHLPYNGDSSSYLGGDSMLHPLPPTPPPGDSIDYSFTALTTVYNEYGPGECTIATNNVSANPDNTNLPFRQLKAIDIGAWTPSSYISFTKNTTFSTTAFTFLRAFVRLKSVVDVPSSLSFRFYLNGVPISSLISCVNYGLIKNKVGTYMNISIPLTAFGFTSNNFDELRFEFGGSNSTGIYLDLVQLQNATVDENKYVTDIHRIPGTLTVQQVLGGVNTFAYTDSIGISDTSLLHAQLVQQLAAIQANTANILLKLNTSDTAAMLSHYLRVTDTTGQWAAKVHTHSESDVTNLVSDLAGKEPTITAGTSSQYWRGDKTWQTLNTDAVAEATNKYYTDTRARAAITLTTTGTSGAATYNSTTGVLNVPQYATTVGTITWLGTTYNINSGNNITLPAPSTTQVSEGTNLYYTDARARGAISVTGAGGSYNSSTGVIALTGGGSSQWTTTGSDIYYNSGNVGIGTTSIDANAKLSFGTSMVNKAIHLYDGGSAGTRYGWGFRTNEMQFFAASTGSGFFSWNNGGDLQTTGTNQLMKLASTGDLTIGGALASSASFLKVTQNLGINVGSTGATTAAARLTFGTYSGAAAIHVYDGGAGNRYGWGIGTLEMQQFIANNGHFSINKGGDFQSTAGTNEILRVDAPTSSLLIGTTSSVSNSLLTVSSTTKGTLPFTRMTSTQRLAIVNPAVGLHVYQTDGTEGVYVNKSTGWQFAY